MINNFQSKKIPLLFSPFPDDSGLKQKSFILIRDSIFLYLIVKTACTSILTSE